MRGRVYVVTKILDSITYCFSDSIAWGLNSTSSESSLATSFLNGRPKAFLK